MPTIVDPPNKSEDPRSQGPDQFPAKTISNPGSESEMLQKPDHGENSYRGFGRLQDKVALITGGDSGIGRAVAIAYAREGADVAISYWNEHEDAQETERLVKDAGRRALLLPGDISEERQCVEIIQKTVAEFGRIDVLINNAAYQVTFDSIEDWPTDEWERTFRTNVHAIFWLCKAAVPHMKEGSSIINTASIQGYKPNPQLLAYAPTKAAIISFTKALSLQVTKKKGIRVNAVAPGPVWTPLIPASFDEEKVKSFGSDSEFGRAAQPAEMAPAFVFLASNEAMYMTGEVLGLTGGKSPF
ncbi:MAG TPA: SDR family oxidoreductase [Bryobacteraceae bacterium]|nr:SDR family oxidoreductase [Bryobacteraceae bacterium]